MSDRRIYVVGGGVYYTNWMQGECVEQIEDANLVVFTGGEDVSPHIYGKRKHPTTGNNVGRDLYEAEVFKKARALNLPMWGTCRGSQFLCAMAGGQLVQDLDGHPYVHRIQTSDGRLMGANSTHHQMQHPFNMPADHYELLAWAVDKDGGDLASYKFGETDDDSLMGTRDVEIAFYPHIRAVACQPHPEMLFSDYNKNGWEKTFIDYCREIMAKYLEV